MVHAYLRGLFAASSLQGISHDPQLKKWYISATLLLYNTSLGIGGEISGFAAGSAIITMKIRFISTLIIMLMALSIAIISCKKDSASTNPSNPENPTNNEDPDSTVIAILRNDGGSIAFLGTYLVNMENHFVGGGNNYTMTFANIGEVSGIGNIDTIPQSDWVDEIPIIPGNGYVVKCIHNGLVAYGRIFVVRNVTDSNSEIIGVEIKYQENWCMEPTVTTKDVTDIKQNSAKCGGIVNTNGITIIDNGVCWSKSENPSLNDNHITTDENGDDYTIKITTLEAGTTYYVRAYVTSDIMGITYGNIVTFTTLANPVHATVLTNQATNITPFSATCSGNVTNDGGSPVTERGICWNTSGNPTINDNHLDNGYGIGYFSVNLTNLVSETSYYFKAYAINSTGISYGEEVTFTTLANLVNATVITDQATNITPFSATCSGNVTNDGGSPVTERGICWNTSGNPTINDNHLDNGYGIGYFSVNLTNLVPETSYYFKAYAINSTGISYGEEVTFTTYDYNYQDGFSVNDNRRIYFSKGNLQYQASTNTWRFADHQYDFVGNTDFGNVYENGEKCSNTLISSDYSGWIDLFGWGTSGYDHGAVCYQPWSTSMSFDDYYAYGEWDYNLYDQTGMADWGYNEISNGDGHNWRTLKYEEWNYLFNIRNTLSGIRYAKAQINNISGIIILPDNWVSTIYVLNATNTNNANYSTNIISVSDWIGIFEANGASFLPAGSYRHNTSIESSYDPLKGYYWSSSQSQDYRSKYVEFNDDQLFVGGRSRGNGLSVRLVRDVQ